MGDIKAGKPSWWRRSIRYELSQGTTAIVEGREMAVLGYIPRRTPLQWLRGEFRTIYLDFDREPIDRVR